MNLLSHYERHQFQLIVENARRERWVDAPTTLAAQHSDAGAMVTVRATQGAKAIERTYPRDERWLFQLVRDLAWGSFKT